MKAEDLMTTPVCTCTPETSLHEAAGMMLQEDCGVLPVVDEENCLMGMITDRDICMCAMIEGCKLEELAVSRAMSQEVLGLRPTDTFAEVCAAMTNNQVRRLPVMTEDHELLGIVGVGDLVLAVSEKKKGATQGELVKALSAVTIKLEPVPETSAV